MYLSYHILFSCNRLVAVHDVVENGITTYTSVLTSFYHFEDEEIAKWLTCMCSDQTVSGSHHHWYAFFNKQYMLLICHQFLRRVLQTGIIEAADCVNACKISQAISLRVEYWVLVADFCLALDSLHVLNRGVQCDETK